MARTDYGNSLLTPVQDETGALEIDAYGLIQASLNFTGDRSHLSDSLADFTNGVPFPFETNYNMVSHKYTVTLMKAGMFKLKVDYVGVELGTGYTIPKIHGIVNTSAQPIESHVNFSTVQNSTDFPGGHAIGGTAKVPLNGAIFNFNQQSQQYSFGGFGVLKKSDGTEVQNIKQGIRQFLKPGTTVRGEIYFDASAQGIAEKLSAANGCYLHSSDSQTLIYPWVVYGPNYGSRWLVTAAPIEPIGRPTSETDSPMCKVTYDLLYGGTNGWDKDIYPQAPTIFT